MTNQLNYCKECGKKLRNNFDNTCRSCFRKMTGHDWIKGEYVKIR